MKKAIFALVMLSLLWAPSVAGAIGVDHSWTHMGNNNYAEQPGSNDPECQPNRGTGCMAWDSRAYQWGYQTVQVVPEFGPQQYVNDLADAINRFVNPVAPSGVASESSPYYTFGSGDGNQIAVTVENPPDATHAGWCAWTIPFVQNRAPWNDGCCQQQTIVGARIVLNAQMRFNDAGYFSSGNCEIRALLTHELGHTLGLGHTVDANQVMYPFNHPVYNAANGDQHGIACIYNQQQHPEVCSM